MAAIESLSTLSARELAAALRACADHMIAHEPADIARLRERKLDTGREFSVWEYTIGYCMNLADVASVLRDQAGCAARGEEPGDIATLARTMERLCTWYAGQYETTGKMVDTEAILARCAELFTEVDDAEVFCDLARGLERYIVQLMFWVDRQLPWSAVSDLVHGYRLRRAASAR